MWNRIKDSLMTIQVRTVQLVRQIKADDRGLSGVVVAILLILVAVLAVVIIWTFMEDYLVDLWGRITENTIS